MYRLTSLLTITSERFKLSSRKRALVGEYSFGM